MQDLNSGKEPLRTIMVLAQSLRDSVRLRVSFSSFENQYFLPIWKMICR